MNSIDHSKIKEIGKLKIWAAGHAQPEVFLSGCDKEKNSYYRERNDESTYISEYEFSTLPELEKMFDEMFHMDFDEEIRRIAGVCAMRCRREQETDHKENTAVKELLPEHIYVF